MHLWTEYEGRTVAGSYTLGKLLRSEGRNGFFTTADSTGNSAVIRLTEAHFDEEEVLKRWRQVAELHQSNLIEIERVGKTDFDGVALTYALMERNDANLEDVLKERPLTTAETIEVAKSVLAALATLHASGLVHEHIEPVNVLAVGDVVKLRSDCVRECVADGEFTSEEACEELRRRDVQEFGALLLRCLTLEREWSATLKLAEPFRRIVPAAIDGHMSLRQIDTILNPPSSPAVHSASSANAPEASLRPDATASRPPLVPSGVRQIPAVAPAASAGRAAGLISTEPKESTMRTRPFTEDDTIEPVRSAFKPVWFGAAIVVLLIIFALWHMLSGRPGSPVQTGRTPAAAAPPSSTQPGSRLATTPKDPALADTRAAGTPEGPAAIVSPAASHVAGWYVIAYTYNHENQARTKVLRVERKREGFHPAVFSPSAHGPYLVSLGGPMSESEAESLMRKARHAGLPRDTFIRKY